MTDKQLIKNAIVFSARMDLREALRDSLKKIGVEKVDAAAALENALDLLGKDARALLVIDFELGWDIMHRVLNGIRSSFRIETRPIVLIAKAVTPELVGLSYEYHISAVHTGEISKNHIKELVAYIAKDEALHHPLRGVLQKVTEKRDLGDWDAATKILDELAKKVPDNPKIVVELAENLIKQERWSEALKLLEPFASSDPAYVWGLHLLGRCHMKLGEFDRAAKAFEKAQVMNPFNVDRLLALGQALLHSNETSSAGDAFRQAQALEPDNEDAVKGEGQCLLLEGDVNEALSVMRNITSPRDLAAVFNGAAILAMRNEKFEQGMGLYEAAFKAITGDDTTRSRLFFNKGIGYRRWNKDNEAMACFEQALKCDDNYDKAKYQYGRLAKKLGIPIPAEFSMPSASAAAKPRSKRASSDLQSELRDLDERMDQAAHQAGKGGMQTGFDADFEEDLEDDALTFL